MSISFGIKTSQINTSYGEVLRVWQEADEIDAFDSAWVWDHLVPMRGEVTAPAHLRPGPSCLRWQRSRHGSGWVSSSPRTGFVHRRCSPRWPRPLTRSPTDD